MLFVVPQRLTRRYMAFFWSFSVAGYFLPILLRAKGIEKKLSTADTYLQYVWICKYESLCNFVCLS